VSRCRGVEVSRCRGVEVSRCRGVEVSRCRGVEVSRCRGVEVSLCHGQILCLDHFLGVIMTMHYLMKDFLRGHEISSHQAITIFATIAVWDGLFVNVVKQLVHSVFGCSGISLCPCLPTDHRDEEGSLCRLVADLK
jgi:hypothetical protein